MRITPVFFLSVLLSLSTLTFGMNPRNIISPHDIFMPESTLPNVLHYDEQVLSTTQIHVSHYGQRHGMDGPSCLKYTFLPRAMWNSSPTAP
jgi:hypothetical protein